MCNICTLDGLESIVGVSELLGRVVETMGIPNAVSRIMRTKGAVMLCKP